MDLPKAYDAYDVIGVITPGVVVALLLAIESAQFRTLLGEDGFSVGDLGLFLVISFVLGHLIQSFGNLIELMVWPIGGLPTNRLRFTSQNLVTPSQRDAFAAQVRAMESSDIPPESYDRNEWRAVISRAYARVRNAGRSARIDVANRTYGLFRGLAAAFAVSLGWYSVAYRDKSEVMLLLSFMLVAAVWRMRRVGVHYARALILEFIDLPPDELSHEGDLRASTVTSSSAGRE